MSLDAVAVVVMAKYPEAGKVKTRLAAALTPLQAAQTHREFLLHVAARLDRLAPAELIICYDPPQARDEMRQLLDASCSATYLPQAQGGLGVRLAEAHREVGELHRRVLFVGVDSPDVPDDHLVRAAELTDRVAVSLGPTADGGFWCLGLWNQVDAAALLEGVNFSSGKEARQTLEHAGALGHATALAEAWDDVDHPEDLRRLLGRLARSDDPDDRRLLARLEFLRDGV